MRLHGGGREQAEGELLPVIDELMLKIKELVEEKGKLSQPMQSFRPTA